jgi:4'-phosphopantetheinyl transferase
MFPGKSANPPELSLSHEPGLSVAAICTSGKVGVDLMRIEPELDWIATAQLYLAPRLVEEIGLSPEAEQAEAFARAWTQQEARLKYCGLALHEWDAELERELSVCRTLELGLPAGYCGALALRA